MEATFCDVAIVGGGPAGISAAFTLAGTGLKVMLLDENARPGGQLLRGSRAAADELLSSRRLKRTCFQYLDRLRSRTTVKIRTAVQVINATAERELAADIRGHGIIHIHSRFLLLATGARERFMPFKGWTLPGVISTGAAQILLKSARVLPAKEVLIAGAGPFLYSVAHDILTHGGRVPAVFDITRPHILRRALGGLLNDLPKLIEGVYFFLSLFRCRTSLFPGTTVLAAEGHDTLNGVVTAGVDACGVLIPGTERRFDTRCLAIGNGFVPNLSLARLAGCTARYTATAGGWTIHVNPDFETTVPGIYAAGEITGIGGGAMAATEGELCALSILKRMELISWKTYQRRSSILHKKLLRLQKFASAFNLLSSPGEKVLNGLLQAMADDTVICRCEDVTLGDIRRCLASGGRTARDLKLSLRTGMGRCQGNTCQSIVADILSAYTDQPLEALRPDSVRIPVKPVSLGVLAES